MAGQPVDAPTTQRLDMTTRDTPDTTCPSRRVTAVEPKEVVGLGPVPSDTAAAVAPQLLTVPAPRATTRTSAPAAGSRGPGAVDRASQARACLVLALDCERPGLHPDFIEHLKRECTSVEGKPVSLADGGHLGSPVLGSGTHAAGEADRVSQTGANLRLAHDSARTGPQSDGAEPWRQHSNSQDCVPLRPEDVDYTAPCSPRLSNSQVTDGRLEGSPGALNKRALSPAPALESPTRPTGRPAAAAILLQSAWRGHLASRARALAEREHMARSNACHTLVRFARCSLTPLELARRSAGLTLDRFARVPMARQIAGQTQVYRVATFLGQSGGWWHPGNEPHRAPGSDLALAWHKLGPYPPRGGVQLALPRLATHLSKLQDRFSEASWLTLTPHQWKTILAESGADTTEPLPTIRPNHWIRVNRHVFVPRGGRSSATRWRRAGAACRDSTSSGRS